MFSKPQCMKSGVMSEISFSEERTLPLTFTDRCQAGFQWDTAAEGSQTFPNKAPPLGNSALRAAAETRALPADAQNSI